MLSSLKSKLGTVSGSFTHHGGSTTYVPPGRQATPTAASEPAAPTPASRVEGGSGASSKAPRPGVDAALAPPSAPRSPAPAPVPAPDLDALAALLAQRSRVQALVDALQAKAKAPAEQTAPAPDAPQPAATAPAPDANHVCEVAKEVVDLAQRTTELLGGLTWRNREDEARQQWRLQFRNNRFEDWNKDDELVTPVGWEPIDVTYKTLAMRKRKQ